MASITTRSGKGSPLTHAEVDANFTNLNTDKAETAAPTFTGQVKVAAGTAAAPGVAVAGDPNTGIYSPGADQVAISTGGTERLRIDATGQIEAVSLGTAAAPTYTFTGDPNSGLYSPGADQVAISTGGTGRLFVDASGTVGINTSANPTAGTFARPNLYLKQFSDPSSGFAGIHLEAFGEQSVLGIGYNGTAQAFTFDASYRNTGAFRPIAFTIGNQERLRITSAGLVGIGTVSPNTALNVVGKVRAQLGAGTAEQCGIDIYSPASAQGVIEFLQTDGSPRHRILGDGDNGLSFDTRVAGSFGTALYIARTSRNVGIGTTSPGAGNKLHVAVDADGDYAIYGISPGSSGLTGLNPDGTNGNVLRWGGIGANAGVLRFMSGVSTERARIDSSGRLLVGTASARANIYGISAGIQLEGAANNTFRNAAQIYGKDNAEGPLYTFAKHRSASVGGQTVVSSGDELGQIVFTGSDGTSFIQGATIKTEVDGTPGANDMPGRLVFSTTADGAASPTERMRISSAGTTTITSAASTAPFIANISTSEVARLDSSGRLLVGTSTSNGARLEVTETRRLNAQTGASAGWIELTDVANVTSGTLATFATLSLSANDGDQAYFRIEVRAGHTGEPGYSSAVSIREGLVSGYGGQPRILNSTETRNLTGSVNSSVIATALTTNVVAGNSGGTVTFSFQATATLSGSSSGSAGVPRISYRVAVLSSSNVSSAALSSNI